MNQVIVAYQPNNSPNLYPYFYGTWKREEYVGLYYNFKGELVATGPTIPIAKWTIRLK